MTEQECLQILPPPGAVKDRKANGGVIQIIVTSSCNLACNHCTQSSQLRRKPWFMTPGQFEEAVLSLDGYPGTVGLFGGNPTVSKYFEDYCNILKKHVPKHRCGIWCNHPLGKAKLMRDVFDPKISNLNVHLDHDAWNEFRREWPESMPFGLNQDSRHSPCFVSMKDVIHDEAERWRLISTCDVAHHWSSAIGLFRGELRAWACEIAMSQSLLMQHDPNYPDTGVAVSPGWWRQGMTYFAHQVRHHCHRCSVPLRGYGALARDENAAEQTSPEYVDVYKPKKSGRAVELVTTTDQLYSKGLKFTDYLGGAKK